MKLHHTLATFATLAAALAPAFAANSVYPHPQVMEYTGGSVHANNVITLMRTANSRDGVWERIPKDKKGAYAITVSPDGEVQIAANDKAGLFYARQTLSQLLEGVPKESALTAKKDPFPSLSLKQMVQCGALPVGTLVDWPDLPYRGIVEGYYGRPWTFDERVSQLNFCGRNKMNIFIYGPKDDPYHHGEGCYKPYPQEKAEELAQLVEHARHNHVHFVWAIHPANTVDWNKNDGKEQLDGICKKLQSMYDLGVRDFAVFVDDTQGEIGKAEKQAALCNYIVEHFIRTHPDVNQELLMCPTGYTKAWTEEAFLNTLGQSLDPSVHVMWTGDTVVSDITLSGQRWVHERLKRPTFVWWNWPTTDYKRSRLSMGRTYGLEQNEKMKEEMSGFVSNPMEYAEASKIALFGVADYSWNIMAFRSMENWHDGIKRLFPSCADEVQIFCNHNSFLLPNFHKYVREESVRIAPAAKAFTEALEKNQIDSKALADLREEMRNVAHAGHRLLESNAEDVKTLQQEIGPWLQRFCNLGIVGQDALDALLANDYDSATGCFFSAMDAIADTGHITRDNWEADGSVTKRSDVEVASLVLKPLIDDAFACAGKKLYANLTGKPVMWAKPVFTCQGGEPVTGTEYISDGNLDTFWQSGVEAKPDDCYYFDFHGRLELKTLALYMGGNGNGFPSQGQFEYSVDGKNWKALGQPSNGRVVTKDFSENPIHLNMLRYRVIRPGSEGTCINELQINKPLPDTAVSNVAGLNGMYILKTAKALYVVASMEVQRMHAGEFVEIDLAKPTPVHGIRLDMEDAHLPQWSELSAKLDDGSEVQLKLKRDGDSTLFYVDEDELPERMVEAVKFSNSSNRPHEIRIAAFSLTVPPTHIGNKKEHLTDIDFATSCDCTHGYKETLNVPQEAQIAIVVGRVRCTLNGKQGVIKEPHIQFFFLDPDTDKVQIEAPAQKGRIHEVIFL